MRISSSPFPLIKVSATGNDFILVDLLSQDLKRLWRREQAKASRLQWVRKLCDRHDGLGADGAVFLESAKGFDFAWDFYNSDGSRAEMCGNAARAVSLYAHVRTGRDEFAFKTRIGTVRAYVQSAKKISIGLPPIEQEKWSLWAKSKNGSVQFDLVRPGVPHAVVRVPNLDFQEDLIVLAQAIKRDSRFKKEGVNVTFLKLISGRKIASLTYERGVEGFTKSCGTGAIAAAYSLLRGETGKSVEVTVPGGKLSVLWHDGQPILTGPARIVAEAHWITGG
jgi:diaminopimelate epimerase